MRSFALLPLLLAILLCCAEPARAAESESQEQKPKPTARYEIYFDRRMGAEAGSNLLSAAVSLVGAGEEKLFRPFEPGPKADGAADGVEDGATGGAAHGVAAGEAVGVTETGDVSSKATASRARFPTSAGIALRALRTIVWDAPIAWWFGIMQHEMFGHGGRAREFDANPGVHMGSPWKGRGSYSSFNADGLSTEELLYISSGGVEANGYAATFLERRVVAGVRMRPIDLLFLASNRLVLSDYVLRTTPDPAENPAGFYGEFSGGGDVAHYIDELLELNGVPAVITPGGVNEPVQREYEQLERQAIWNALDPGVWWALGSMVKMVVRGDRAAPLPLPRWGRFRFLPTFSAQWTPSGGQVSLEWIASREETSHWFSIIVRRGDGPAGPFGAIGGAIDDRFRAGPFWMGGTAEVWHDPRNGLGAGGRLRSRIARGRCRGFFFDVGVKSQGYWVGQPARAGLFGGIGYNFTP